jgi:hypothetical protein
MTALMIRLNATTRTGTRMPTYELVALDPLNIP